MFGIDRRRRSGTSTPGRLRALGRLRGCSARLGSAHRPTLGRIRCSRIQTGPLWTVRSAAAGKPPRPVIARLNADDVTGSAHAGGTRAFRVDGLRAHGDYAPKELGQYLRAETLPLVEA